jgi:hypothetical protein
VGCRVNAVSIIEEASWTEAAKSFGAIENVDAALEPIIEALALNPAGFPEVPGFPSIRIAKTDRIERDGVVVVPALRVWLRYRAGEDNVYLLYAEEIPDDA